VEVVDIGYCFSMAAPQCGIHHILYSIESFLTRPSRSQCCIEVVKHKSVDNFQYDIHFRSEIKEAEERGLRKGAVK
jgi:hypothetical protein